MSFSKNTEPDLSLERLIAQALVKLQSYQKSTADRWLLVDVAGQRLVLLSGDTQRGGWPVSTAAAGLDNQQDSGGTPAGVHRIAEKIGADCPAGTVFSSRKPTGTVWQPGQETPDDLILTRILTLDGCQPGINRGPGIDSLARYIYLHGTNHEPLIGQPVSHGCIRLTNADITAVFDLIEQGDTVVII